jgi:hypothetical protein
MILYELPVIFTAYNKKRRYPLIAEPHAYLADFVPFDQAYQATDWSAYESMPAFEAGIRGNAYRIYLEMEAASF